MIIYSFAFKNEDIRLLCYDQLYQIQNPSAASTVMGDRW